MQNMRRIGKWIFFINFSVAILPVLLVVLASLAANLLGCNLDEAAVHTCYIGGIDIGGMLSLMGLSGWLALVTLPIGGGLALLGLALYVVARIVLHRKSSVEINPTLYDSGS